MRIGSAAVLAATTALAFAAPAAALSPAVTTATTPTDGNEPTTTTTTDSGTSTGAVILVGLLGVALGAGGTLLVRGRRPAPAVGAGGYGSVAALPPQPASAPAGPSRDGLIRACIEVADQEGSEMLRERLHAALAEVDVRPMFVDGQPFDQRLHRAVGTTPTDDPRRDGTIATTQRLGWTADGRPLRLPDVLVFRVSA
jgi:hypothetical protein